VERWREGSIPPVVGCDGFSRWGVLLCLDEGTRRGDEKRRVEKRMGCIVEELAGDVFVKDGVR